MLKHTIIPLLALAGATAVQARTPDPSLARQEGVLQWVDTRIGTSGHGHTFMGAAAPFGAVQLGPNNFNKGWDWCSGYHDSDSICVGFAHLHLNGTGCSDTGDLLFMPTTGEIRVTPGSQENPDSGYASRYSHQREATAPAYYRLHLDDYGIDVELTATERVGFHRYTFPSEGQKQVVINLFDANGDDRATETFIEQQDNHTVRGYRCSSGWSKQQRIYFTARFSEPVTLEIYKDDKLAAGSSVERGINLKGVARLDDSAREVLVKVGISPVSMAGAARNIVNFPAGTSSPRSGRPAANGNASWAKSRSKVRTMRPAVSSTPGFTTLSSSPTSSTTATEHTAAPTAKTTRTPDTRPTPYSRYGTPTAPRIRSTRCCSPNACPTWSIRCSTFTTSKVISPSGTCTAPTPAK